MRQQQQHELHKGILWNSLAQQAEEQRERKKDKNFVAGKIGAPPSYVQHEAHNSGLPALSGAQPRRSVHSLSPLERFNLANNDDRLRALMPPEVPAGNGQDIPYDDSSPTSFNPKARRSTWDRFVHASDEQRLSRLMSSGEGPLMQRGSPSGGNGTSLAIGSEYVESDERKAQYKNFLLRQIEEKQQRKRNPKEDYGGWFNNESRQIRNAREYHDNGSPQSVWGVGQSHSPNHRDPPALSVGMQFGGQNDAAARKEAVKNDLLAQIEENKARKEAAKAEEMENDKRRFPQEIQYLPPRAAANVEPWDYHRPDLQPRSNSRFGASLNNDWGVSQNTSLVPISDAPDDALVQRNKVLQLKNDLEIQIEERKRIKLAEKERERAEEERIERDVQRVAKEAKDRVDAELERKREKALEDDRARLQVAAMVQKDVEDRQQNRKSIAAEHRSLSPAANRSMGSLHSFHSVESASPGAAHFSPHPPPAVESHPANFPSTLGKNIRDVDHRSFEHDIAPVRKWHGDHQTPENVRRYYNYDQRSDSVAREDFNQPQPRPLSVAVLEEASPTYTDKSSIPEHFVDPNIPHHLPSPLKAMMQPTPMSNVSLPVVLPDSYDDGGHDSLEGSRMIIHDPETPGRPPVAHIPHDGPRTGASSPARGMNDIRMTLDQDIRQLYSPSPKRFQPIQSPPIQQRVLPEGRFGHDDGSKLPVKAEELVANANVVHEAERPADSNDGGVLTIAELVPPNAEEDDLSDQLHHTVADTLDSPITTPRDAPQNPNTEQEHASPPQATPSAEYSPEVACVVTDDGPTTKASQPIIASSPEPIRTPRRLNDELPLNASKSLPSNSHHSESRNVVPQHSPNRPPRRTTTYKSFLDEEDRMSVGPSPRFDVRHYNTNIAPSRKELPHMDQRAVLDSEVDRHSRFLSNTYQSHSKLLPLDDESQRRRSNTIGGLSQLERDLMAEVAAMARERFNHLSPMHRPIEVHVIEEDYPRDNSRRM